MYNEKPSPGDCTMEPSFGFAFETEFNMVCREDPEDEDEPLMFEVSSRFNPSKNWTAFYKGNTWFLLCL